MQKVRECYWQRTFDSEWNIEGNLFPSSNRMSHAQNSKDNGRRPGGRDSERVKKRERDGKPEGGGRGERGFGGRQRQGGQEAPR